MITNTDLRWIAPSDEPDADTEREREAEDALTAPPDEYEPDPMNPYEGYEDGF